MTPHKESLAQLPIKTFSARAQSAIFSITQMSNSLVEIHNKNVTLQLIVEIHNKNVKLLPIRTKTLSKTEIIYDIKHLQISFCWGPESKSLTAEFHYTFLEIWEYESSSIDQFHELRIIIEQSKCIKSPIPRHQTSIRLCQQRMHLGIE